MCERGAVGPAKGEGRPASGLDRQEGARAGLLPESERELFLRSYV